MKNLLLSLIILGASIQVSAQSLVTKSFRFEKNTDVLVMPPDLRVDIDFVDDNDNKILEALEKGTIKLVISNKGGDAKGVKLTVTPEGTYKDLTFGSSNFIANIPKDSENEFIIPVTAGIDVPTDSVKLNIAVAEPLGYDIYATMLLSTYEFQKSKLKVQGVSIIDAGKGLRAMGGNPDGKLQKGEVAKAVIAVQNIGQGEAKEVRYTIKSADPNLFIISDKGFVNEVSGTLKNLKVGEATELAIKISPNNRFQNNSKYIPLLITVNEQYGKGDIFAENVPIALGKMPDKPNIITIDANYDKLLALRKTEIYSDDDRISSKIKIRDISIAPFGDPLYADAVAIVIGAEQNGYNIAPAPYAARDAKIMAKYFKTSMGISDVRLYTDSEVTKAKLSDIFDANGELMRSVERGKTDVFVYYSGHGMPDESVSGRTDIYLFPYDGRKDMLKERGYSLSKLYTNLNSLGAKSVTVILDACFSGSSRQTTSFEGVSIGNAKGISVKLTDMEARPWDSNPNFRLITSSSGEQTSLGFDQSQSGLFTYYMAIGMQGDADLDKDGTITLKELFSFVSDNVSTTAKQIRNGDQTPQLFGNDNLVIEKIN